MEFSQSTKPSNEDSNFTVKIYKKIQISVYKPLVPLKIAQFCCFGGASYMMAFLTIFLKQKGVSLSELSWMNVIASIVQLSGTTLTGVFADKIGNLKPVLLTNLFLALCTITSIRSLPPFKRIACRTTIDNFSCLGSINIYNAEREHCVFKLDDCNLNCLNNSTYICNNQSSVCKVENNKRKHLRENLNLYLNEVSVLNGSCFLDTKSNPIVSYIEMCSQSEGETCNILCSCQVKPRHWLLLVYGVFYVFYLSAYTNVYRCLDIAAVALVQEHNADFGRERFFAVCGSLMISPLAGYLVDSTTVKGGEKNYEAGLYLFIFMLLLVIAVQTKIPVRVHTPSEKMWRKSLSLLKNPDILSLIFAVLVLGAAFNFTRIYVFWFLSNLNAPSVLVGLLPSINALSGLPFLLSSNWWVKKIGCTNLIILAFLGYVLSCAGYSFLINPWYSLLLELLGAIEYYLLWVAVVIRCHELAPEGMSATVVAVAGALHYSIGKATGGMVGGLVMNNFGERITFRFIATICLISAFLYGCFLRTRKHLSLSREYTLSS